MISVFLGILVILVALAGGLLVGFHYRMLYNRVEELLARQAKADEVPEPQVIVAKTPKEVFRSGDLPDESAIVSPKSPKDIQRDKDRKFDEEMARLP